MLGLVVEGRAIWFCYGMRGVIFHRLIRRVRYKVMQTGVEKIA